jgi:ribosomal protein S18 acetylase RimI-like enzyme
MTIVIQDAIPEDDDGIRYVQHQTWLATYPNEELGITREAINARFVNVSEETLKRRITNKQRLNADSSLHIWVAKDEQNIVGFCIAVKEALNGHVRAIYVLPSYQGRGVGKGLLQTALNWLGNKKPVTLAVATYNKKAMEFYRTFGFVPVEESVGLSVAQLAPGVAIPQLEMIRPLSS